MTFEYSKDVVEIPKYLDLDFFEDVVENALYETNVKVLKVHFMMGSAVGENFLSILYRIKVHYELLDTGERGELSTFVKCLPVRKGLDFLEELKVFGKEKKTFLDILPKLCLFQEPDAPFAGRLYHFMKRPVNCLALEDLNTRGYRMAAQEVGFDEKHSRLVMKRIGQFHAISMHLAKKDPNIQKEYRDGLLARHALKPDGFPYAFFSGNANALLQLISKWPDYSKIADKLRAYIKNIVDNLVRSQIPQPQDLVRVLNHGDLWFNNVLFKYDGEQKAQNCIFIDYQMSVWTSPGIDLNYFLYTSVSLDVLKTKREELLKEYYGSFHAKLVELNYEPIPSYEDICTEVRRRASYGFFANYCVFPICTQDKTQSGDSSLDNFTGDDFAAKKLEQIYSSKRLAETLRYTLKEFDRMGIWD
uniref:CHK kinase-like domain-containing protein n=1 Tax=Ceratitis capitata TaxID=7213 RepID=W8BJ95_CERCA